MKTEKDLIIQLLMWKLGIVRFEWSAELSKEILRQDVLIYHEPATMTHVVQLVPKEKA